MVNVVSMRCGHEGCAKQPSYGVGDGRKAEFCSQHAKVGMVDVVSKQCCHKCRTKQPSFVVGRGRKAEFCSQHAKAGTW